MKSNLAIAPEGKIVDLLDSLDMKGRVLVEVRDVASGDLISSEEGDNMIVGLGRARIMALLAQSSTSFMSHLAASTSATAIADGDTVLASEVSPRVALGSTDEAGTTLVMRATLGAGDANGNTLASAAIFDAASSGLMFAAYVLTTTIAKTSSISVTFSWTWSI